MKFVKATCACPRCSTIQEVIGKGSHTCPECRYTAIFDSSPLSAPFTPITPELQALVRVKKELKELREQLNEVKKQAGSL